jgi:hypothetical protein
MQSFSALLNVGRPWLYNEHSLLPGIYKKKLGKIRTRISLLLFNLQKNENKKWDSGFTFLNIPRRFSISTQKSGRRPQKDKAIPPLL